MPGLLLHVGATVQCIHGGRATPTVQNSRVLVGGQPTATLSGPWVVAGCALPPSAGGPCVTAQWTVGTTRVTSGGQPLLISTGSATCAPTGSPLLTVSSQTKATGT